MVFLNTRTSPEQGVNAERQQAAEKVAHAIQYLEPFGEGRDLEYIRARTILHMRLAELQG